MTLHGQHVFETPLIASELDGAAAILPALLGSARERQEQSPGDAGRSWSTDRRMLRWAGEPAVQLLHACVALADRFTADIDAPAGRTRYGWSADLRASFPGSERRIGPDCFPSAFWSVLALASEAPSEVKVVIDDPRGPLLEMEDPGLRFRAGPGAPALQPTYATSLATGQLLMFPAWLMRHADFTDTAQESALITLNLTAFLVEPPREAEPRFAHGEGSRRGAG
jgi:hypothetical protein